MKRTQYNVILLIWVVIETFYLLLTRNVYEKWVNQFSTFRFSIIGAFLSYMCLLLGFINFVSDAKSGLLFGFIVFGIYNFTNLSTLDNYPINMVVLDMTYGILLFGLLGHVKYIYT